jgi:hypothetical protein
MAKVSPMAAQVGRRGWAAGILVRLLLVEGQFFVATLVVRTSQFRRGELRVIEQIGRETMSLTMAGPLWVIERVLDHPHDDTVAIVVVRRRINVACWVGQIPRL